MYKVKTLFIKALHTVLVVVIAGGGFFAGPPQPARADDQANPFVSLNSPISLGGRAGTSFSPNAAYMAVAGSPAKVFKRNCGATYSEVASLGGFYNNYSWDASFSPDGTYLALALKTNGMCVYKRSGDSFSLLPAPDDMPLGAFTYAAWSPDGTYLALTCNDSPKIILYKRSGDTFTRLSFTAWTGIGAYSI